MYAAHVTVLEASANRFPEFPVFKVPILDSSRAIESWSTVSYRTFLNDVQSCALYWLGVLAPVRIHPPCTIGFWVEGFSYRDYVYIYGLSRAGFTLQLISLSLSSPEVVYELLKKAGAEALLYAPSFETVVKNITLPKYPVSLLYLEHVVSNATLPPLRSLQPDDTVFIFHTSGSTSGSPKLVPCRASWVDAVAQRALDSERPRVEGKHIISTSLGSMCHIAQTYMFLGTLQNGSCVVLPANIKFSTTELVDMIARCGLNRLQRFASFLGSTVRDAKDDSKVLSLLSSLDELVYSGVMEPEEEQWAFEKGLRLRSIFGMTECGAMLESRSGADPRLFYPMQGFVHRFEPIDVSESSGVHQTTAQLLELVIPSTSSHCPHSSLRDAKGDFRTGDLFQKVSTGVYIFRGRDDDWIKSENSLRCDTKAIEDNARQTCSDIIGDCVVVGAGRPSPAIFVEPVNPEADIKQIKREIIYRTRNFHSRRYTHERISSPEFVFIVPRNTLPRTAKGNIRRKEVEVRHKVLLDELYKHQRG